MTSVRGRGRPRSERLSVAPSVTPSVAPSDSSPPPKLGDELSDPPVGHLGAKPPAADAPVAATNIPKYSQDDLQRILKAVLETRAPASTHAPTPVPAPAPAPAPIVAEEPREKLKA